MKPRKNFLFRRDFIEIGVLVLVVAVLYGTGYHTELIGKMQELILNTGMIKPEINKHDRQFAKADYSLSLVDKNGEVVTLDEYRGQTVFLNFWATWCPPCIAEMPGIHKLYEDLNGEDVIFIMVSFDDDISDARAYMDKKDYDLPVYRLAGGLPDVYRHDNLPTTFIISPGGEVVTKRIGMAHYNYPGFREFLLNLGS